jgi:MFS family permease
MFLVYATLLPSLAFGMFYTDVSYFLSSVQGIDMVYVGVLIMVMALIGRIQHTLGIVSDRYGRRKMLILGNVAESLIIAFFALTKDPALLMGIAVLAGLGEGGFAASSSALLADKQGTSSGRRRSRSSAS